MSVSLQILIRIELYNNLSLQWGIGASLVAQMEKNLPVMQEICSVPGSGRVLGEGNRYSFQYSCLENPMDRGAWWTSLWGCKELDTVE